MFRGPVGECHHSEGGPAKMPVPLSPSEQQWKVLPAADALGKCSVHL